MSSIISKDLANQEIRNYLSYQQQLKEFITNGTEMSSQAITYFTSELISFTFEKNQIVSIWDENPDAEGIRVYYGSLPDSEGIPTMAAIPYKMSDTSITNDFNHDEKAGVEFPQAYQNLQNQPIENFDISQDNTK